MRLLTMLATAVLLAACVHDTDDFTLFVVESGASLTYKKDCPFPGDRFWRTVQGESWGPVSDNLVADMTGTWPRDHFFTGASLLVELGGGKKDWDDPWNRISELFAAKDGDQDGFWDTTLDNFSTESVATQRGDASRDRINDDFGVETTYTGSGKMADDPWNVIGESFPLESVQTGKGEGRSFRGRPVVEMLFVSVGGNRGGEEDAWGRIGDLFPTEESGGVLLKLVEVRGQVGRFSFVSTSDGESLDGPAVFAVGVPLAWAPGLVLRGEAYLLGTEKMFPLIPGFGFASSGPLEVVGAVVWEMDRTLSPGPSPKERGDVAGVIGGTLNSDDYD